jgi:hypothetical protein
MSNPIVLGESSDFGQLITSDDIDLAGVAFVPRKIVSRVLESRLRFKKRKLDVRKHLPNLVASACSMVQPSWTRRLTAEK